MKSILLILSNAGGNLLFGRSSLKLWPKSRFFISSSCLKDLVFPQSAVRIACVPLKSIVLAPRVKTMPSRPRLRLPLPSCTPTICNLVHDHSTKRRGHQSPHRTACYARVLIQSSINQPGRYGRRGHTNPFLPHPVPRTALLPKHLECSRRQRSFNRLVAPTLQLLLRQWPISTCAPLCVACSRALSGPVSRSGPRT